MAACEGLVYNVPLEGDRLCTEDATVDDLRGGDGNSSLVEVTLEAEETGFYYFIFANENEITDNFLFADFHLNKTAFDVSGAGRNCTGVTECSFPLAFWSGEQVVLEAPQDGDDDDATGADCSALLSYSSYKVSVSVTREDIFI